MHSSLFLGALIIQCCYNFMLEAKPDVILHWSSEMLEVISMYSKCLALYSKNVPLQHDIIYNSHSIKSI